MINDRISSLGGLALDLVQQVLEVIQEKKRSGQTAATMIPNPHVRQGYSAITPADLPAQRVYTQVFAKKCPDIALCAEEKDPTALSTSIDNRRPTWVIDGLDGSTNFSQNATFGYGTQCALWLPDGSVPIAIVGNAVTGDIFSYVRGSGAFWTDKNGRHRSIDSVSRPKSLANHTTWYRPARREYHQLSLKLLQSRTIGRVGERLGGIGTTMAELLTEETGVFALRPHTELPWDAIPAYALCHAAGMVFMIPDRGGRFMRWYPHHQLEPWKRWFDLFVLHESRLPQFYAAVEQL